MSSARGTTSAHGKEAALYEEQLSKIGKVKAELGQLSGKSALYCSDASIARYLIARNWNVKKATEMLLKTLEWRSKYGPDMIRWEDVSDEAVTGKIYRTDYFDKSGRSVLVMRPRCQNTQSSDGQIKYLVYCLENAILNLSHGQDQMVWLIDFTDFSLGNLSLEVTKKTATVLQCHYPERLGVAILYNAPKFFQPFWKAARIFLDKKTKNKVKFVYPNKPNTMRIIEDLFNMDELESAFGGKNPATFNVKDYALRMIEDDKKMPSFWSTENSALASQPYLMSNQKAQASSSGAKIEDTESEKKEASDIESEEEEEAQTGSSTAESKSLPEEDTVTADLPGEDAAPADKRGL